MIEYFRNVFKNRKILFSMIKNDFTNRFANTSLGAVWGFVSPVVVIFLYVFVFEYILKLKSSGDYPYLVWFLPGMAMWTFLNEAILITTNSIRDYSFLVKKVVFPVDIIPLIKVFSTFVVSATLILMVTIICVIHGYMPNLLLFVYYIFAALFFVIGLTRMLSAFATMLGDFAHIVPVVMQLMFWATPTVWNIAFTDKLIQTIVKCNPLAYLVCGMREVFVGGNLLIENNGLFTILFWIISIFVFIYGNKVFNKNKDEFSDML